MKTNGSLMLFLPLTTARQAKMSIQIAQQ